MTMWRALDFGWPEGGWLLLIGLLIVIGYILLDVYRNRKFAAFANTSVLQSIVVRRPPVLFWTKVVLLSVAWLFGVAAVMQPRGNPHLASGAEAPEKNPETRRRHDIAFILDVSASMGVADDGPAHAQRLRVAKEVIDTIIGGLHGENVALLAFTSQPIPVVPLTTDYLFTRLSLRELQINEAETAGTDILKALQEIFPTFDKVPASVAKTLVLVSDGGDTALDTQRDAILKAAGQIKAKGVRILVVGLGSSQGAPVPKVTYEGKPVQSAQEQKLMQEIASSNGYFDGNTLSSLTISQQINNDINSRTIIQQSMREVVQSDQKLDYQLYFQYPLAIALIALGLFIALPETARKRETA